MLETILWMIFNQGAWDLFYTYSICAQASSWWVQSSFLSRFSPWTDFQKNKHCNPMCKAAWLRVELRVVLSPHSSGGPVWSRARVTLQYLSFSLCEFPLASSVHFQKHSSMWLGYTKLPLGLEMCLCIVTCISWTGISSQSVLLSHRQGFWDRLSNRINQLGKMNKLMNEYKEHFSGWGLVTRLKESW